MERISRNHFLRLALGGTVATGLAMVGLADRSVSPPTAEPVPTKSVGEPNPTIDQPLQGIETPFAENEDGVTFPTGGLVKLTPQVREAVLTSVVR